jgi:hypothetical protein
MHCALIRGLSVVSFAVAAVLHSGAQVSPYPVEPAISGTVIGPCEEAVSGVKVTLMRGPAGQLQSATTDDNGFYRISGVPPGSNSVQFVRSGFRTEIKDVLVRPIGATEVGVRLTPTRGGIKGRNDPRCQMTPR